MLIKTPSQSSPDVLLSGKQETRDNAEGCTTTVSIAAGGEQTSTVAPKCFFEETEVIREMAQCLRILVFLQIIRVWFSAPMSGGSKSPVTLFQEDLVSSSGL